MDEPWMESRVLAATDLSAPADEAVRQADRWARLTHAELEVVQVLPREATPAELEAARFDLQERVSRLTGRGFDGFEAFVAQGDPAEALVARAWVAAIDRLVVGSRGLRGLPRLLLGSVAERVVRHAPCPVLVARPDTGLHHIVVGTDFSAPSMPALEAAADEARWLGVPVTIVHCLEQPLGGEEGVRQRRLAEQALGELSHRLGMLGDVRVTHGAPAEALSRTALECGAQLVVVATQGRTGASRVMLGSVAEATVRGAPCSVLVVRKPLEREPARPGAPA